MRYLGSIILCSMQGTNSKETEMESKIRIKLGAIEVEFEGSEQFLKKELPDLIKTVSELYKGSNLPAEADNSLVSGAPPKIELSTGSIATKLGCKSGGDLALAAAAHLTFAKKTPVFKRKILLSEMKTASAFYKASYSGNLTKILNQLLKSKFNEPSSGSYALTAETKEKLGGILAKSSSTD